MDSNETKRKRRSKNELEGKKFACDCGKNYFSFQALVVHKKTKHPEELPAEELIKKKRGRPKLNKEFLSEENEFFLDPLTGKMKNASKKQLRETCDEIFSEYLEEKKETVPTERFSEIRNCIFSLRECINRNSEKVDSNDFLRHDDYTVTEKPELIPNIVDFYIEEYLPQTSPQVDIEVEKAAVVGFFQWLKAKNYTELEVDING